MIKFSVILSIIGRQLFICLILPKPNNFKFGQNIVQGYKND